MILVQPFRFKSRKSGALVAEAAQASSVLRYLTLVDLQLDGVICLLCAVLCDVCGAVDLCAVQYVRDLS